MPEEKKATQLKEHEVIGVVPGPVVFKGKEIDLSIITDEEAALLFEQGIPYLQKKKTPKASVEGKQ